MKSLASTVAASIRAAASATPAVPLGDSTTASAGALFAGGRSRATQELAALEKSATLFAVINRIITSYSRVHWDLYRDAPSGNPADRTIVQKHAALDLWRRPNPFMVEAEFQQTTQQHEELTGEQWWLLVRSGRARTGPLSIPLEMYPITPARMRPVPGDRQFIVGYEYTSPDGQIIPLDLDDVIYKHLPNPTDPYRGLSPVASLLIRMDMVELANQWNRAFFRNSADAGGVITVNRKLTDDEWRTAQRRWAEAHRGVNAAHRVAIIEGQEMGWQPNTITQRDMQFIELDIRGRDVVYEAYGISSATMGVIDNANRAVAEAGRAMFAELLTDPRCSATRDTANFRLLPMFGSTTRGLKFDYESPIPADTAMDNATRDSQARSTLMYVQAGYDPEDVLKEVGAPPMRHTGVIPSAAQPPKAPVPGYEPAQSEDDDTKPAPKTTNGHTHHPADLITAGAVPLGRDA